MEEEEEETFILRREVGRGRHAEIPAKTQTPKAPF